ncbi:MAG: DUF5667 domain-containing protein [Candidatus Nanoarchaeia archaeon]|nr:DUF5667 domain-containing protein [Candidatus Nanoarchaeia archaeon]MDD5587690.1 DUF5667 domain-containing protein [Candidatus Nanoarchaeia archaeon]
MKKIFSIFVTLLLVLVTLNVVLAEDTTENVVGTNEETVTPEITEISTDSENLTPSETTELTESIDDATTNETENVGATPDQPVAYGWKRFAEKISLWMTISKEKQAEKKLQFAQRRLSEMKEMAKKGDLKSLAKAEGFHAQLVQELSELKEQFAKENVTKSERLEYNLQKHITVLDIIQQKLQAKNVTSPGIDKTLTRLRAAEERYNNMSEVKQERVANKVMKETKEQKRLRDEAATEEPIQEREQERLRNQTAAGEQVTAEVENQEENSGENTEIQEQNQQ